MNSLHSGKRFCTLSTVWFIDMIIFAMIIVNFKLCEAKARITFEVTTLLNACSDVTGFISTIYLSFLLTLREVK